MEREEYTMALELVFSIARMVSPLPLKEMLEMIELSETLGPIVDPTLWRNMHQGLDQLKELLRGLRAFQQVVEKLNSGLPKQ